MSERRDGYPLPGAAPEANAIFGGHLLGISRLYTIDYKTSALVRQIAISLADIGDQALSARVGLVERVDYNGPKGPQTQAAVAEAIRELKTFYAHAAGAGRAVIFTVDI